MDAKTSCLVRGIIGVIFGVLALLLPEVTRGTFYGIFWVLIAIVIFGFLFLAITAKGDESMLWFGLSAGLLFFGVLSFIVSGFIAIIFILIIAATALYNGFSDITLALTHPKTKYILIPCMIIAGFSLLVLLMVYFPNFWVDPILSSVGTFAFVFGIFSILMGFYNPRVPENTVPKNQQKIRTFYRSGDRK